MKKITWFLSSLLVLLLAVQTKAADVYVKTSDPTFNVYTWSPETFGSWPGTLITDLAQQPVEVNGIEYYKFSLEGTGRFIIFNKGGVQTSNIPLQDGDNYFTYPIDGNFNQYETTNAPIPITSYTIVGSSTALFGAEWDTTLEDNDMTLQEDGTYKLVKENVELTAGNIEYKVVGNHVWGLFEQPTSGNQNLQIDSNGIYEVTFTLTLGDENTLTAVAVMQEEQPVTITSYTVVGAETLLGAAWDVNAEANDMTLQENGTYVLVKDSVELNSGYYDYKVVGNHNWASQGGWELPTSGNQTLQIDANGIYEVTFTLTLGEENTLTAVAVMQEEQPVTITSYTVVGAEALLGAAWDVNAEANDMTLQENGTYVLVKDSVELNSGYYDYKVVGNHNWASQGGWELPTSGNQTLQIDANGIYEVTFTLTLGEENTLTATTTMIQEILPDYELHYGIDGSEWQYKVFVPGEGVNQGKLVVADVTFEEDTQFGIKYGDTWYAGIPDEGEGLYWIHDTWCTDIPLNTGDEVKNFIINEPGTYTFILTIDEENGNTLTVKGFPLKGDINGDGQVDVEDVNALVNIILNKATEDDYSGNANLDGENDVDVTDLNVLVNILLGK